MQFMTNLFGGSASVLLNSAFALGLVLVLIVLGLWALKLLTNTTSRLGGSQRRLVVVDKAQVDGKRQVLIIRRDNVEHLIMTGGPQDVVIESGIAVPPPVQAKRAAQRPAKPAPTAVPEDIETPIMPDRPVSREAVDRLNDLARPAPLRPRTPAETIRHTGLFRREVIPMSPGPGSENSAGGPTDSATTGAVEGTSGQLRLGSKGRHFRGVMRGDRT